MKIEKGKFYRTRGGVKAEIYSTDNPKPYPIHGRLFSQKANSVLSWTQEGKYDNSHCECGVDIIAEWKDAPDIDWSSVPKWFNYWAQDENGAQCFYANKPEICGDHFWFAGVGFGIMAVPTEYRVKYTGDWKYSLTERMKQ